ncbi:MAG: hypothetical protein ACI4M9_00095, partial [Succinivibrio sp.]
LAIIGDHYFMGDPDMFKGIERRIRNLFFGDLPEVPEEKQSQFISPVDMAPTILEAAGATWGSSQFGIGVSIFSKDKSLIEKVGQKEYNSKVSLPSALYLTFY